MEESELTALAADSDIPKSFEFAAYIYYNPSTTNTEAVELWHHLKDTFSGSLDVLVDDHLASPSPSPPPPPHTLPFITIQFSRSVFADVVLYLCPTRGPLTVLICPLEGGSFYDFTQGAIWLGRPVPLNLHLLPPQ